MMSQLVFSHGLSKRRPASARRAALVLAVMSAAAMVGTQPAHAQGFLKRLKERALQEVGRKAEQAVTDLATRSATVSQRAEEPAAEGEQVDDQPSPPAAKPAAKKSKKKADKSGPYASNIPEPEGFKAISEAYSKFAEVPCDDCEGGKELGGWPRFPADQFSGQFNERAKRIGALALGQVHRWQVKDVTGTLAVVGEETVNGLRCRRLQYKVRKKQEMAERPGLVCLGKEYETSSLETWHEIY